MSRASLCRRAGALAPLLALCLLPTACRERGSFTFQTVEESFCDGVTVTVIATSEHIVHSKFVLEHGSGRYDEVTRATALVRWSLPESPTNSPVKPLAIRELDRQHAEAADASGAHVEPVGFRAFSGEDALVEVDSERGNLRLLPPTAPAGPPLAEARIDPLHMMADVLVTRSGRHLLATRLGRVLIYSTSDLELVRELESSPGLADFEKRFRGVEDHARFLTDDLRYLVKIPFNAGEPQGFNHCVAVIHDLESGTTSEVRLSLGEGATAIEDLEHVDGRWLFLVDFLPRVDGRQLDTRRAIVEADSSVVAWLPDELFSDERFGAGRLCWDPARTRVAVWGEAGNRNFDGTLDTLVVAIHDYAAGATVDHELDWADTAARLGAR